MILQQVAGIRNGARAANGGEGRMKATMILAIVGVVAVLGVAGAAVASGVTTDDVANALGMGSEHQHQWSHQWDWSYSGDIGDTPLSHYWNYTWDYNYNETCPTCA
jgi:hypothetical protein